MDIKNYLGKRVEVIIDRPIGSKHPKFGFNYEVNYGFVPGTKSSDGEELDAYLLGIDKPIDKATGICIAIIHRTNDNEDKLVVAPEGKNYTDGEIEKLVEFQEKWFKHELIRS
jgi:inorganic pyrophosphatase